MSAVAFVEAAVLSAVVCSSSCLLHTRLAVVLQHHTNLDDTLVSQLKLFLELVLLVLPGASSSLYCRPISSLAVSWCLSSSLPMIVRACRRRAAPDRRY